MDTLPENDYSTIVDLISHLTQRLIMLEKRVAKLEGRDVVKKYCDDDYDVTKEVIENITKGLIND